MDHGGGRPIDRDRLAREDARARDRRIEHEKEVRATALELAIGLGDTAKLYDNADSFSRYIETGERPA